MKNFESGLERPEKRHGYELGFPLNSERNQVLNKKTDRSLRSGKE